MIKVSEKADLGQKTSKERFEFIAPEIFRPDHKIMDAEIIKASEGKWYFGLIGKVLRVEQIDFEVFLAIDYQDVKLKWLRFIILKEDLKIIE